MIFHCKTKAVWTEPPGKVFRFRPYHLAPALKAKSHIFIQKQDRNIKILSNIIPKNGKDPRICDKTIFFLHYHIDIVLEQISKSIIVFMWRKGGGGYKISSEVLKFYKKFHWTFWGIIALLPYPRENKSYFDDIFAQ